MCQYSYELLHCQQMATDNIHEKKNVSTLWCRKSRKLPTSSEMECLHSFMLALYLRANELATILEHKLLFVPQWPFYTPSFVIEPQHFNRLLGFWPHFTSSLVASRCGFVTRFWKTVYKEFVSWKVSFLRGNMLIFRLECRIEGCSLSSHLQAQGKIHILRTEEQ